MGTSFLEIYNMALGKFIDPDIKYLFNNDEVMFNQVMYNFLENAIPLFKNPIGAAKRLVERENPYYINEKFIGDDFRDMFIFSKPIKKRYKNSYIYRFLVNDNYVSGKYDEMTNSVILDVVPKSNDLVNITLYYPGAFKETLYLDEVVVLAQFLSACWAENVMNDKLDIMRILGDTDFKLTSNAGTTTAKSSWFNVDRELADKRMNSYAWNAKMRRIYR